MTPTKLSVVVAAPPKRTALFLSDIPSGTFFDGIICTTNNCLYRGLWTPARSVDGSLAGIVMMANEAYEPLKSGFVFIPMSHILEITEVLREFRSCRMELK